MAESIAELHLGALTGPLVPIGSSGKAATRTRVKLLLAAETLFGERSVEGVSLRDITAAACQTNSNAVQYHFGSKEGLVQALLYWRTAQAELSRAAMFEALGEADEDLNMKELVKILLYPFMEGRNEAGEFSFAAFVPQYIVGMRSLGVTHPIDFVEQTPMLNRTRSLMLAKMRHVDVFLARRRLATAVIGFCAVLTRRKSDLLVPGHPSLEAVVSDTIEQVEYALLAPAAAPDDGRLPMPLSAETSNSGPPTSV